MLNGTQRRRCAVVPFCAVAWFLQTALHGVSYPSYATLAFRNALIKHNILQIYKCNLGVYQIYAYQSINGGYRQAPKCLYVRIILSTLYYIRIRVVKTARFF